jgi:hypothetical protein
MFSARAFGQGTDMANDPASRPDDLVGVFDPDRVPDVRAALARLGLRGGQVHVDERPDHRASLRAEQVEEVNRAMVVSPAGITATKEPAKAMAWTMPAAGVAGAVVGALLALIPVDGIAFGPRLFWYALIGALAVTTIAFVVTSAMAVKDPFEVGAAQRGVVVRVEDGDPAVRAALVALRPIRLDLVAPDGSIVDTIHTDEEDEPGGAIEELARNVEREAAADPADRHR